MIVIGKDSPGLKVPLVLSGQPQERITQKTQPLRATKVVLLQIGAASDHVGSSLGQAMHRTMRPISHPGCGRSPPWTAVAVATAFLLEVCRVAYSSLWCIRAVPQHKKRRELPLPQSKAPTARTGVIAFRLRRCVNCLRPGIVRRSPGLCPVQTTAGL